MNRLKRRSRKLQARMYASLPKDESMFKLELVFLMLAALILVQKLPGGQRQTEQAVSTFVWETGQQAEDEPEERNGLKIQFVSGNKDILEQEVVLIQLPEKAGTAASGSITDAAETEEVRLTENTGTSGSVEEEETPQNVAASGTMLTSMFSPVCYPALKDIIGKKYFKEDLTRLDYLRDTFYIVNSTTRMTEEEFDVEYFLEADLSVEKSEEPQILIYHTHASEGFVDSRPGVTEDTVIGAGDLLAQFLEEKYGYNVIHDTTVFDMKNGKDNRSYAYNDAQPHIMALLEKYPTIEVVIDLHRDAGDKRVTTIDGKKVAKVMLFNGLCRTTQGKLVNQTNENLADNLAFSFQMKLIGDEMYPGLMHRIFLKDYRYNMHLMERYLLIELGTNMNTVEEAKNAMEPLADVLAQVLGGEN
ncbi:MAG: stage II sporulation protein P [Lachnospiraceae bacterium]|nr:stage II sporulation protein P [Lachnospiraceae bacterium]